MIVWLVAIGVGVVWTVPVVRRRARFRRAVGDVDAAVILDLAAAALGAGVSIPGCLRSVDRALAGGVAGKSLTEVGNLLILGARWEEAWDGTALIFWRLRQALEPAWSDGAAPVALLARSAESLRQTKSRRAKEAAARLGSRLVLPLGLCFLPAFVLLGVVPIVATLAGELF